MALLVPPGTTNPERVSEGVEENIPVSFRTFRSGLSGF